jgi:hypothetical protein
MTLASTSSESYFRDSIIKFFIDGVETAKGIPVIFDKFTTTPDLESNDLGRWLSVVHGSLQIEVMSRATVDLYLCTRKDFEGAGLSEFRDIIFGVLSDRTDGVLPAIPLYESSVTGPWVKIGAMVVTNIIESKWMDFTDQTKFKMMTVQLRFASRL